MFGTAPDGLEYAFAFGSDVAISSGAGPPTRHT